MKAAFYDTFQGSITLEQIPDPEPRSDGVVIGVKATGICLSDWHGWMGHDGDIQLPHVPGHELAGEIVAIGKGVQKWKIGDRVTLPFVCGCGSCPTCKGGDPQVCPDQFQPGFTHWGSFAEYVSIHYADANLVALPPDISYTTAASLGCRFATSYRAVCQQALVQESEYVAVFGCGGVGLSAVAIASARGAHVIAIDTKIEALNLAQKMGAESILLAGEHSTISEEVKTITDGGAHVTIDAIGNPDVLRESILSLRRRGRHIQIGLLSPDRSEAAIPVDRVIAYELSLHGSHGMAAIHYEEMLALITNGILKPELLVHQELSLQEGIKLLPRLPQQKNSGVSVITHF